jgi:hypothetical protein
MCSSLEHMIHFIDSIVHWQKCLYAVGSLQSYFLINIVMRMECLQHDCPGKVFADVPADRGLYDI